MKTKPAPASGAFRRLRLIVLLSYGTLCPNSSMIWAQELSILAGAIEEQLTAYKESRTKLKEAIKGLKANFDKAKLEGAATPQLDEIKGNIRSLLKGHRKEQNVFRKMVRQKVRALRKDRLKKRAKKPTKRT